MVQYFGENVKNFSVPEFKDVVKTLDLGEADYGVLPIENSSNYKDRIKELEIQVRTLQIENAFLKELRKLRKQEACEQIKQSQKLSLASEDNSN